MQRGTTSLVGSDGIAVALLAAYRAGVSELARAPSMADVAARAGVSMMTVSRVFSGQARVAPETRDRVIAAVEALKYRPNMAARTLAGGPSHVLGVITIKSEFYGPAQTLIGIETAARDSGHLVSFVGIAEPDADELRAALAHLANAHADGVIVIAPVHRAVQALRELTADGPIVVTGAPAAGEFTVGIDQRLGARLATRHLLDLGHRTVHHIRGPKDWIDADERASGWRQELRSQGRIAPKPLSGDWSPRAGYEAGRRLAADADVTAIFAANDQMALGVLLARHEARCAVPDDVSVVGFDDIPEAGYLTPPLTTIRQDFDELGRRCVDHLLGLLGPEPSPAEAVAPHLVIRNSSASPPPAKQAATGRRRPR